MRAMGDRGRLDNRECQSRFHCGKGPWQEGSQQASKVTGRSQQIFRSVVRLSWGRKGRGGLMEGWSVGMDEWMNE